MKETARVSALFHRKAIATAETLEGVDGHARAGTPCARRLRTQARTYPVDHPVSLLVLAPVGEPRPVVHIDLRHPPDEQLQFVLIKRAQHVERRHVPEPFHECAKLLHDTPGNPVRYDAIDLLLFFRLVRLV